MVSPYAIPFLRDVQNLALKIRTASFCSYCWFSRVNVFYLFNSVVTILNLKVNLPLTLFYFSAFFVSSFHTYDFARHFVNACMCILGTEATSEGVVDQGKLTRVAVVRIHLENLLRLMWFSHLLMKMLILVCFFFLFGYISFPLG